MKNTKVLVEELEQGKYDSVLLDLYVDAENWTIRENVILRQSKNMRKHSEKAKWKSIALREEVK